MEVMFWWAVATGSAVLLCFLPLTSLLGYESSAVMGVLLGLVTMRLTALEWAEKQRRSSGAFVRWWLDRLAARLVFTGPPLLVLLLNALRVPNCDPAAGLVFWLVIPMVSVVFGHALTAFFSRALGSARRGLAASVAVVLLDAGWFLVRLVQEPPITGVHSLFGYFAGSIYDEALDIPSPLLWYRALILATALGLVLGQDAVLRVRAKKPAKELLWAAAMCWTLAGTIAWRAEALGFWLDREDIADELGAAVSSEHFVIHYDPSSFSAEEVASLVADHEFRYAELAAFFAEDPIRSAGRPLHSFVYPDRSTQQALFGSRNTFVARPWTYEMHVRWSQPGETALAHELAHLFTAPFGGGPLSLATDGGWFVHLGLVEGIALAADWPPLELTPHEAAAAMRTLEIAPNLRELFEPTGFWSQPSGKAYTLMGSFVRWLVDTRGIARFKEVYAMGDWQGVYGVGTEALIAEWEAFVDAHEVDDARLEMARFRYSRRSIFGKVCARTLAELRRQARNADSQGDYERALSLQQEIQSFQPASSEPGLEMARLLVKLQRWDDAMTIVDELLARTGGRALRPRSRAEVEELRADILWQADRPEDAAEGYERCLGYGHTDAEQRKLQLKRMGSTTEDEDRADFAFHYLFESKGRTRTLWAAREWADHAPDDALARYLLGFQLFSAKLRTESIPHLAGPPGTLALPELDEQRQVFLATALAGEARYDEARAVWIRLLGAHSSRVRLLAVEGLDRIRFAQGQPLEAHPKAP